MWRISTMWSFGGARIPTQHEAAVGLGTCQLHTKPALERPTETPLAKRAVQTRISHDCHQKGTDITSCEDTSGDEVLQRVLQTDVAMDWPQQLEWQKSLSKFGSMRGFALDLCTFQALRALI